MLDPNSSKLLLLDCKTFIVRRQPNSEKGRSITAGESLGGGFRALANLPVTDCANLNTIRRRDDNESGFGNLD